MFYKVIPIVKYEKERNTDGVKETNKVNGMGF